MAQAFDCMARKEMLIAKVKLPQRSLKVNQRIKLAELLPIISSRKALATPALSSDSDILVTLEERGTVDSRIDDSVKRCERALPLDQYGKREPIGKAGIERKRCAEEERVVVRPSIVWRDGHGHWQVLA